MCYNIFKREEINMQQSKNLDFIAYEYLSVNVPSEKEPLYMDCYENFGWKVISTKTSGLVDKEDYYLNNANINGKKLVNLKFKRNRGISNKAQVMSLQNKCDNALNKINVLENEPHKKGAIYATINAIIGSIFMAISVFAVTSVNPNYLLTGIFGAIGIIIWILSYVIYKQIKNTKLETNASIIEEQYNIIYNSCEQAKKLLNE